MTASFPPPRLPEARRGWSGRAAVPSVAAALLVLTVAFGLMAAVDAMWPEEGPGAVEAIVQGVPMAQAGERSRCETCGRIESITRVEASASEPAAFVFAVRLPDGSLRLSSDPLPGRWQVGDRMQLLGGGITWSPQ